MTTRGPRPTLQMFLFPTKEEDPGNTIDNQWRRRPDSRTPTKWGHQNRNVRGSLLLRTRYLRTTVLIGSRLSRTPVNIGGSLRYRLLSTFPELDFNEDTDRRVREWTEEVRERSKRTLVTPVKRWTLSSVHIVSPRGLFVLVTRYIYLCIYLYLCTYVHMSMCQLITMSVKYH